MTKEDLTIALVEPDAAVGPGLALPADDAKAQRTSLLSERMGLLAGTALPAHANEGDRRMEDWIASHLDLGELSTPKSRSPWARLIENLPGMRKKPTDKTREQATATTLDSWKRFQVAYKRGITVVRLLEKALVKESQIRDLARDLLDLIAAGNHRVVLSFQAVERVASWMAFVVDEASRRCAAGDGGSSRSVAFRHGSRGCSRSPASGFACLFTTARPPRSKAPGLRTPGRGRCRSRS